MGGGGRSEIVENCVTTFMNDPYDLSPQLLLLLNREEDPTAIVSPHFDEDFFESIFDDSSQMPPNATHKMVLDIFQVRHLTNILRVAFLHCFYVFGFVIFWRKEIVAKAACKMLVKLTTGGKKTWNCIYLLLQFGYNNRSF